MYSLLDAPCVLPFNPATRRAYLRQEKPVKHARGILIVDDDELVRSLLGMFFRDRDFPVWLASDGEEAVDIFEEYGEEIGTILLDLRMPDRDGPETLRELQTIRSNVICYLMSDTWYPYSPDELWEMGIAGLLSKSLLFEVFADVIECCAVKA